jgi:hypothetical protein
VADQHVPCHRSDACSNQGATKCACRGSADGAACGRAAKNRLIGRTASQRDRACSHKTQNYLLHFLVSFEPVI